VKSKQGNSASKAWKVMWRYRIRSNHTFDQI